MTAMMRGRTRNGHCHVEGHGHAHVKGVTYKAGCCLTAEIPQRERKDEKREIMREIEGQRYA